MKRKMELVSRVSKADGIIKLDADKKEVVGKNLNEVISALYDLNKRVKEQDAIEESYVALILNLSRSIVRHSYEDFGVLNELDKELEEAYAACRSHSQMILDLRKEMAKGVTYEAIGAKLHELQQIVYAWWTEELGFSYCSFEVTAGSWGATLRVKFSTNPNRHISTMSKTPVTDKLNAKKKVKQMQEEFEIVEDKNDEDFLVDTDANKKLLVKKLQDRFPGSNIHNFESYKVYNQNKYKIIKMQASIELSSIS